MNKARLATHGSIVAWVLTGMLTACGAEVSHEGVASEAGDDLKLHGQAAMVRLVNPVRFPAAQENTIYLSGERFSEAARADNLAIRRLEIHAIGCPGA